MGFGPAFRSLVRRIGRIKKTGRVGRDRILTLCRYVFYEIQLLHSP